MRVRALDFSLVSGRAVTAPADSVSVVDQNHGALTRVPGRALCPASPPTLTPSPEVMRPAGQKPPRRESSPAGSRLLPEHDGQHCPGRMVGLPQAGTGQVMSAHISRPL